MFEDTMTRLLVLIIFFVVGWWSGAAWGQSNGINLAIPQTPQSFQSDRVRAGDVECSAAIGSATNVEFGVVGILNQEDPIYNLASQDPYMMNRYNSDQFLRDIGVYGKITIPIGAPKQRLNCNALYQLELEKKRLEVMKLQQEIVNLRQLKFEGSNTPTASSLIARPEKE
jgi:hypothetical protein